MGSMPELHRWVLRELDVEHGRATRYRNVHTAVEYVACHVTVLLMFDQRAAACFWIELINSEDHIGLVSLTQSQPSLSLHL